MDDPVEAGPCGVRGDTARAGVDRATFTQHMRHVGDRLQLLKGNAALFEARAPDDVAVAGHLDQIRSEEHTSELQSLMRITYDVLCLQKKKHTNNKLYITTSQ